MARIRTIKPEFWTDSKTGQLSEFAKCLFIGLLNMSDDFGVVEFAPDEWRAKIFPYHSDTTPTLVIKALTNELLPLGLLIIFAYQGDDGETKRFAFIRNFNKHQVINKPSKPLLDGWKKGYTPKTYAIELGLEHDELTPDALDGSDSPPTPLPEHYALERKGKEGKGKEIKRADARDYVFNGLIVRLTSQGFEDWERAFPRLDLRAELTARDAWLASDKATDDDRKRWFISTSKYLANRNAEARAKAEAPTQRSVDQSCPPEVYRNVL